MTKTTANSGSDLMTEAKKYIAVDLGAESGRVMLGKVSEGKITLEEAHRFPNAPIEQDGSCPSARYTKTAACNLCHSTHCISFWRRG